MDTNKYDQKIRAIPYPEYPRRPAFPKSTATPAELRQYADAVEAYNKVRTEWSKESKEYRIKHDEIIDEFKAELFKELGIEKNPKAELLYSIAWQKGHSGGLGDVWAEACDLVELIQ